MSDTMVRPETIETDTDEPKVAHYVTKTDATRSFVEGTPIRALCGKIWVPSRDGKGYPICKECKRIKEARGQRNNN